jgi:putative acetyltransferase
MLIRAFQVGDAPHLRRVFMSAVHGIAFKDYTHEQVIAWAPEFVDPAQWADYMRAISPFVVEHDGKPVAYADLQPSGYIDHFYVSAPFARQGVGSKLMRRLHEDAAERSIHVLESHVSRTAQPFFQYWGFAIIEARQPVVRGVIVPNALMKKDL